MYKLLRITCLLISILSTTIAFSKAIIKEELYLFDQDGKYLELFYSQQDLVVDQVSDKGYELYGPDGLEDWIKELKIDYINMLDEKYRISETVLASYPSNSDNEKTLKKLAKDNPNIFNLISLGKSIRGKEIWTMKISDNPAIDETEPEVSYIANMHGNEIVGRELMMRLLSELAERYKNGDQRIKKLINNTEIFITPTMNPDGSDSKRRSNANWADLNRDFPDFVNDPVNNGNNREVETKVIMKFLKKRHITLSANFHDGAVVVNYPWDCTVERPPLNDFIIKLSKEYASTVPGMYDSTRFEDGITNGHDWYMIHGSMQDWSYYYHGNLQVTVELSQRKWPSYSQIPIQYKNNKKSLVQYLTRVHSGAGFKVHKRGSGTVTITKIVRGKETRIGTYGFEGLEYYKVLDNGLYRFDIKLESGEIKNFYSVVDSSISKRNGNYTFLQ